MGLACFALSTPDLLEEFRAMVHKASDRWVDGFVARYTTGPSTVSSSTLWSQPLPLRENKNQEGLRTNSECSLRSRETKLLS